MRGISTSVASGFIAAPVALGYGYGQQCGGTSQQQLPRCWPEHLDGGGRWSSVRVAHCVHRHSRGCPNSPDTSPCAEIIKRGRTWTSSTHCRQHVSRLRLPGWAWHWCDGKEWAWGEHGRWVKRCGWVTVMLRRKLWKWIMYQYEWT